MSNNNEGVMPISNPLTLGIDLGTTNSCASVYVNGQTFVLDMEQSGQKTIPSIVRFIDRKPEETVVGNAAKKYKIMKPNEVFSSVKSLMQDESWRDNKDLLDKYTFDGVELTPKDIAQKILEEVLRLAQNSEYGQKGSFDKVVICVPANSTPQYKNYVKDIAKAVGFGIKGSDGNYLLKPDGDILGIDILSEPSAAAISYAKEKGIFDSNKDKEINLLVYDFGGGTFDVTILTVTSKSTGIPAFDIKGTYGVPNLGGDDIDKELAMRLMPKVYPGVSFEELESRRKDKLMNEVERMKIEFSEYDDYTMTLGEGSKPIDIDYDMFSDIITPLITENVLNSILKIMEKANVSPENIDAVILAGGSSGLRPFADIILSLFGEDKIIFDDENNRYQWMVAKGAAITSAIDCDFRLSDDICILLSDGETYPILKKDVNKVGDQSEPISFSLTTDSYDAHFIFTDSTGKNRYATISVNAKGYVDEKFDLAVGIGKDQIARVVIKNDYIGNGYRVEREINKLRFYYDLKDIEE